MSPNHEIDSRAFENSSLVTIYALHVDLFITLRVELIKTACLKNVVFGRVTKRKPYGEYERILNSKNCGFNFVRISLKMAVEEEYFRR